MRIKITLFRIEIIIRMLWLDASGFVFRPLSIWLGYRRNKRIIDFLQVIDISGHGHAMFSRFKTAKVKLFHVCNIQDFKR